MEKFNESQAKAEDRKSGFMTCTWLSGMLITLMGSAVHSSKFKIHEAEFVCKTGDRV